MIDAFTDNFAAMDLEMANGNGTSSTTPDPGPTEAGESQFWRIRADWSLDSDYDGSPDWAEFALMADAGHPSYGVADVYNADVDGDGEADGKTIDLDGDGIPDESEPVKKRDKVIDWSIQPQPRYAAFPFQGPSPASAEVIDFPHQTNDQGMVLFDQGVWHKGQYHPLEMVGTDVIATRALGMNKPGEIVGLGQPKIQPFGPVTPDPPMLVWWDDRTAAPGRVEIPAANPDDAIHSASVWPAELPAERAFDCLLDNDRRFVGLSLGVNHGSHRSVWQRVPAQNGNPGTFSRTDAPSEFVENTLDPDITWGLENGQTTIYRGGGPPLVALDGVGLRVSYRPSNRLTAFFADDDLEVPVTGELADGSWEPSPVMKEGLDLSSQGLLIQNAFQLWINRCTWDLKDVAFGLAPPWDADPGLFDLSPNGWLAARKPGVAGSPTECLAGMPVVLLDEDDEDNFATGVDHHSANCRKPYPERGEEPNEGQGRYWAMVPTGSVDGTALSNMVRFLTPASADHPVTLSAPGVDFEPSVLNQPDQLVELSPQFGVSETEDVDVTFEMGTATAASHPVGLRIMKKRVVKLTVWHIGLYDPATGNTVGPELEFTEEALENYLDEIFGKQVNIYWDVTVHGLVAPASINWDIGDGDALPEDDGFGAPAGSEPHPGNGDFDVGGLNPGPEQEKIKDSRYDDNVSINCYIVGGLDPGSHFKAWLVQNGKHKMDFANGVTDFERRLIWVNGTVSDLEGSETEEEAKARTYEERLKTITHEIGHVMLDYGHPDKGDYDHERVHPLKGSEVKDRLMSTIGFDVKYFGAAPGRRKLLVKGEWDEIEQWLVKEETEGRITP